MEREVCLQEISDGKRYGLNDLVKVGCQECEGCSACCQGMGNSIVLDPYDIWQLTGGIHKTFEELLYQELDLNVVEGIILVNLKLSGEREQCSFLNEVGRCRIHMFRPGFCRLFPLGRLYEEKGIQYFLQVKECKKDHPTKIKLRKWLNLPNTKQYEGFVVQWHYFIKELQQMLKKHTEEERTKQTNLYLLHNFYQMPYDSQGDFYLQFQERLQKAREELLR